MNTKLLGPLLTVTVGIGIVVGCGGSSTINNNGGTTDAGQDVTTTPQDSGAQDTGAHDAANDVSDGALVINAPEVTLQYGSCATFTPCGGDPTGTWKYAAGGCLDTLAPTTCPSANVTASSIKIKGILTIGATTIDRLSEATTTATIFVPQTCVDGLPMGFRNCPAIEAGLQLSPPTGPGFDTASCTTGGGGGSTGCTCTVAKTVQDQSSTTYTKSSNTITTGDGKTYDYCSGADASTSVLEYRETTANALPATFLLTK